MYFYEYFSWITDCLQLQVYRDEKERARNGHTKASLSMEDFLAMETGELIFISYFPCSSKKNENHYLITGLQFSLCSIDACEMLQ